VRLHKEAHPRETMHPREIADPRDYTTQQRVDARQHDDGLVINGNSQERFHAHDDTTPTNLHNDTPNTETSSQPPAHAKRN
jgi:hypothetical protein